MEDARFGTTRSWWLRRQEALLAEMLKGLKDTGIHFLDRCVPWTDCSEVMSYVPLICHLSSV